MEFTKNEQDILNCLEEVLLETECVYTDDLIGHNPKALRGALSSLIKKGVIDIDKEYPTKTSHGTFYPVIYWDESVLEQAA